ncbi:MAG TPA: ribonuclease D [Baekduia sp.]|nr:ribonuclease D [Baekduia sp.]
MDISSEELARRARSKGRLGIDTEFMGEGRYQPLLCLVQISIDAADGDGVEVHLLDPLTEEFDHEPLADLLADPEVEIVLHAARQDIALLRRDWGKPITNVFDTQIAAGFAGLRAQMGYEALLKSMVNVSVQKSASFTRWSERPLTPEQLDYAASDVIHLLDLATALQDKLEALGRLDWAREECRSFETIDDSRDIDRLFDKLPKVNSLDPKQRAIARELVIWREEAASEADRPASTVLHESALVEIAKRHPKSLDRLRQIRGVSEPTLHRRGKSLLDAIERGRHGEPIPAGGDRPPPSDPLDSQLIPLCEALTRVRATEAELAYELVASRSDLQRIVSAVRAGSTEPDVRTLQGWRRELVGEEILELLAGKRTLRVSDKLGLEISES